MWYNKVKNMTIQQILDKGPIEFMNMDGMEQRLTWDASSEMPIVSRVRYVDPYSEWEPFGDNTDHEANAIIAKAEALIRAEYQPLVDALTQIVCPHESTEGGNDYERCLSCGIMWDYRVEEPNAFRIAKNALQQLDSSPSPHSVGGETV